MSFLLVVLIWRSLTVFALLLCIWYIIYSSNLDFLNCSVPYSSIWYPIPFSDRRWSSEMEQLMIRSIPCSRILQSQWSSCFVEMIHDPTRFIANSTTPVLVATLKTLDYQGTLLGAITRRHILMRFYARRIISNTKHVGKTKHLL